MRGVEGVEALHRRLAEVDATAAAKLHPNDVRRVIRALEVHAATGVPISRLQQQFDQGRAAAECRVFVLDWPREELDERIRRRVEAMFAAGLGEEVKGLLAMKAEGGGRKAEAESERIVTGLGRTAGGAGVSGGDCVFARRAQTWRQRLSWSSCGRGSLPSGR